MPQALTTPFLDTFPHIELSETSVKNNHARRYRDCLTVVVFLGKYVAELAKNQGEKRAQKHLRSALAIITYGDLQPEEIIWCVDEMWREKKKTIV